MHDIFEGVCHYNLTNVINYFIQKKVFTLDQLNTIKTKFSYGQSEIGNIFKPITVQHLKNKKLSTSAREMWTFSHFFTLMVGDLVPANDEVWIFVCDFIKIIDLLLLPKFTDGSRIYLQP